MATNTVWVGLVGVDPRPGNDALEGARGAFVRFVALAAAPDDFVRQVHEALDEFQFEFDELSDVEPPSVFSEREEVEGELDRIARTVADDGFSRFGEFHVYDNDDG